MKIVVAESVLHGADAFSRLGEVTVLPDRAISAAEVRGADALVIRSKTKVDRRLLEGTSIAWVGTATAGFDHMDISALEERGVAWCSAPGCNAVSVAEYIVSALLFLGNRFGVPLMGRTLAVVGVGQVGRRVALRAEAIGMRVLQNDPPRARAEHLPELRPLEEILPVSDFVTMHVPLEDRGPDATRQMADCRFFAAMKPGAVFLNTSRGEVVDESALKLALAHGQVSRAVLDVWDHEPEADGALLQAATIGTPHIAGYSWDGKLAGTRMVFEQACRFFESPARWTPPTGGESGETCPPRIDLAASAAGMRRDEWLWKAVQAVYDISRDDAEFRGAVQTDAERARLFEQRRKQYRIRREFDSAHVKAPGMPREAMSILGRWGFTVEP